MKEPEEGEKGGSHGRRASLLNGHPAFGQPAMRPFKIPEAFWANCGEPAQNASTAAGRGTSQEASQRHWAT